MISVNSNSVMQNNNIAPIKSNKSNALQNNGTSFRGSSGVSFSSTPVNTTFRTTLITKDEKAKYKEISQILDKEDRKILDSTLKSGLLLNNNSNDKSSVLDNLYKIATEPRAEGLDTKKTLKDTLIGVSDPHTITQKFGNVPEEFKTKVFGELNKNEPDLIKRKMKEAEVNNLFSGCCVAASEQFSLAKSNPAEYVRFAEGLSSAKKSVDKEIKLNNLSENTLDAIWLLNSFEIPYKADNYDSATVTLAPDKNAYTRAEMQQNHRDNKERSSIDVLMQSTFMNVASQQTYNSLDDKRAGKFSSEDSGLIDYEKTFLESVIEDKNIVSVTYQNVDENQRVVGYSADYDSVKSQLLETLGRGEDIIIGYTLTDSNKHIIGAHEITIIDSKTDKNGDLIFVCNDTDDDKEQAIEYPATYLIPKIHHAGLPEDIGMKGMDSTESWKLAMRDFNKLKG